MPWTPEETERGGGALGAELLRALCEPPVPEVLDAIAGETGLARERIVAQAVLFAGRDRAAFLAQLRGQPARRQRRQARSSRLHRFLGENGVELVVAGMFLLGAALAAIQIMLAK